MNGPRLKVGDRVFLNDEGLRQIFGSPMGLRHMKTLPLTVTEVDPEPMTDGDDPLYNVRVDNTEIDQFWITDDCFTKRMGQ